MMDKQDLDIKNLEFSLEDTGYFLQSHIQNINGNLS